VKLLDSNTVIQYVKGHQGVVAKVKSEVEIAVPAIVVYEIEVGTIQSKQTGRRRRILSELFQEIEVVPFDASAALAAARIRCELEERGEGIGPLDTLIAGIAVSRGAILITSNVGEFKRIKGLRIEDWKT
jgi:tRNA(fMet)-specific endonuclease VapC